MLSLPSLPLFAAFVLDRDVIGLWPHVMLLNIAAHKHIAVFAGGPGRVAGYMTRSGVALSYLIAPLRYHTHACWASEIWTLSLKAWNETPLGLSEFLSSCLMIWERCSMLSAMIACVWWICFLYSKFSGSSDLENLPAVKCLFWSLNHTFSKTGITLCTLSLSFSLMSIYLSFPIIFQREGMKCDASLLSNPLSSLPFSSLCPTQHSIMYVC